MDLCSPRNVQGKTDRFLRVKLPTEFFSGASALSPLRKAGHGQITRLKESDRHDVEEQSLPPVSLTSDMNDSFIECTSAHAVADRSKVLLGSINASRRKIKGCTTKAWSLDRQSRRKATPVKRTHTQPKRVQKVWTTARPCVEAHLPKSKTAVTEDHRSMHAPVYSHRTRSPKLRRSVVQIMHRRVMSMFEGLHREQDIPTRLRAVYNCS